MERLRFGVRNRAPGNHEERSEGIDHHEQATGSSKASGKLPVYSLTYVSSAVTPFSPLELRDLLAVCRENNRRLGITGMLLYKDGNFMQVLEGEEDAVRDLYRRIEGDTRHRGEILLLQGFVDRRQFGEWQMGFRALDASEETDGFSDFMQRPFTDPQLIEDPSQAQKLLLRFRKSM